MLSTISSNFSSDAIMYSSLQYNSFFLFIICFYRKFFSISSTNSELYFFGNTSEKYTRSLNALFNLSLFQPIFYFSSIFSYSTSLVEAILRHVSSFSYPLKYSPSSGGLWTFNKKSKNISVLCFKLPLHIKRANTLSVKMSMEI